MYNKKTIYLLSIAILVITSYFSPGPYHIDEYFQILEFAGLKLNITPADKLPWEYNEQMRPTIQPFMVIAMYKFLGLFGIVNSFTTVLLLRLLSALLTFVSMWSLYQVFSKQIGNKVLNNWFLIISFFLWFVVYSGVRFSSENWSGIFFSIAFAYYFLVQQSNFRSHFVIGLLLGFSFICRYQTGFLIAGFVFWMMLIKKENLYFIFLLFLGIFTVLLLGILIDSWFYGEWVITVWNYFEQNIIQNKASAFGINPWWWYLEDFFWVGIPPFSLLFLLSVTIFFIFRPKSPVTWSLFPFILIHFFIGHKEMRFLLPIVNFVPFIFIQSLGLIQQKFSNFLDRAYVRVMMKLFFIINFICLIVIVFKPNDYRVLLYEKIYTDYQNPTTLYTFKEHPYYTDTVLSIYFYKRKNLTIKVIDSLEEIENKSNQKNLIVFRRRGIPPNFGEKHKLVYSSLPDWLLKFNFNHWVEKTPVWYVYELGDIE